MADVETGQTPLRVRRSQRERARRQEYERTRQHRDRRDLQDSVTIRLPKEVAEKWNDLRLGENFTHAHFAQRLLTMYQEHRTSLATPPPQKKPKTAIPTPGPSRGKEFPLTASLLPVASSTPRDASTPFHGESRTPAHGSETTWTATEKGTTTPSSPSILELTFTSNKPNGDGDPDDGHNAQDFVHLNLDDEEAVNVLIGPPDVNWNALPNVEEDEVPREEEELEEDPWKEPETSGKSVPKRNITVIKDPSSFTNELCAIVYEKQLAKLATFTPPTCCNAKDCKLTTKLYIDRVGSAMRLRWICLQNHLVHVWSSQPLLHGQNAGDFMMSASIVMAGQNYNKIARFCECMKLGCVSASGHLRVQSHCVFPAIENYFYNEQQDVIERLCQMEEVVVCGDARCDSPGFSAKYCTYTFMVHDTREICKMVVVDKRQAELKSTKMEILAFQQGLQELLDGGVNVTEVVTDQHIGITKLMREKFPAIFHSYDVWHVAKNLGKKLAAASNEKDIFPLRPWVPEIVRHFWRCCKDANGSEVELRDSFISYLHHVRGCHDWGLRKCLHDDMAENPDRMYLQGGSKPHKRLQDVIVNTRFFKLLEHMTRFRLTGDLENFQELILVYCSKRFSFSWSGMNCRCQLAVIDHNAHKDRPYRTNRDGEPIAARSYNKYSKAWTAVKLKEKKTYPYTNDIMELCIMSRMQIRSVHKKKSPRHDDPKRIQGTIAPVPPPPTRQLLEQRFSRMGRKP